MACLIHLVLTTPPLPHHLAPHRRLRQIVPTTPCSPVPTHLLRAPIHRRTHRNKSYLLLRLCLPLHDSNGFFFVAFLSSSHAANRKWPLGPHFWNIPRLHSFGLAHTLPALHRFFVLCLKIPFVDPSDAVLRDTHNCTVRFS